LLGGDPRNAMIFGGVCMLIAAFAVFRIREPQSNVAMA
jgi:hypothetical protein